MPIGIPSANMPRPWLPFIKDKLTREIREGVNFRADILGKSMVKKTVSKSGHRQVFLAPFSPMYFCTYVHIIIYIYIYIYINQYIYIYNVNMLYKVHAHMSIYIYLHM